MLWLKAFHIIFMVTWFAGLFYLPRLYVYHAMANDQVSLDRFLVMEGKLLFGIMTPGAVLTLVTGLWLWIGYGFSGGWLHAKLGLVGLVLVYHFWCYRMLVLFRQRANRRSHVYFRWMNEVPVLFLVGIIVLVVVKPF